MAQDRDTDIHPSQLLHPGLRWGLIALGWICVALGVIGIVVPGLPTTIFLILASAAFLRSSERFHNWLYRHPRLGPPLQAWHQDKVIPRKAKILAVSMMLLSWLLVTYLADGAWLGPAILGIGLAAIAGYILTRPSQVP